MEKLYPGYTVQNEMTKTGLRKNLGLSVASFYPAVFEALVDIRNQWDRAKALVGQRIRQNEAFSDVDKHYLRYVLSVEKILIAVLNRQPLKAVGKFRERYLELSRAVDGARLENYLRRQMRKVHNRPKSDGNIRFVTTMDGYRYADHGIYLATLERRKRVFIPLTDNNGYNRQIEVRLLPEKESLEIYAPIEMRVREHEGYQAEVGLAMGMKVMLTTHEGHAYGENFEYCHREFSDWLRQEHEKYQRNRLANPGRKKYEAEKRRWEERLHSYINKEINRFLRTEKPRRIYIAKFPQGNRRYGDKAVSYSVSAWQRGYIRRQLMLKCQGHGVEVTEVFGKGIGIKCNQRGATGTKVKGIFSCVCGYSAPEKQNTAANAKKRGIMVSKTDIPDNP
jgi:transposase